MHSVQLGTIGLGIVLGMFFYNRTGRSCGGIITPGFIALQIGSPSSIAMALASAVVLSFVLEGVVRVTGIYGRQRIALAMLLALGCKFMLDLFFL